MWCSPSTRRSYSDWCWECFVGIFTSHQGSAAQRGLISATAPSKGKEAPPTSMAEPQVHLVVVTQADPELVEGLLLSMLPPQWLDENTIPPAALDRHLRALWSGSLKMSA